MSLSISTIYCLREGRRFVKARLKAAYYRLRHGLSARRKIAEYLRQAEHPKLHLGTGKNVLDGF